MYFFSVETTKTFIFFIVFEIKYHAETLRYKNILRSGGL